MEALSIVYPVRETLFEWLSRIGIVDQLDFNFLGFLKETMVCSHERRSTKLKFGPMESKHSDVSEEPSF